MKTIQNYLLNKTFVMYCLSATLLVAVMGVSMGGCNFANHYHEFQLARYMNQAYGPDCAITFDAKGMEDLREGLFKPANPEDFSTAGSQTYFCGTPADFGCESDEGLQWFGGTYFKTECGAERFMANNRHLKCKMTKEYVYGAGYVFRVNCNK